MGIACNPHGGSVHAYRTATPWITAQRVPPPPGAWAAAQAKPSPGRQTLPYPAAWWPTGLAMLGAGMRRPRRQAALAGGCSTGAGTAGRACSRPVATVVPAQRSMTAMMTTTALGQGCGWAAAVAVAAGAEAMADSAGQAGATTGRGRLVVAWPDRLPGSSRARGGGGGDGGGREEARGTGGLVGKVTQCNRAGQGKVYVCAFA